MHQIGFYDAAKKLPCCGVVAVVHVTGVEFMTAWEHIQKKGRKGSRWRGRTFLSDVLRAMKHYGAKLEEKKRVGMTLARLVDDVGHTGRRYLVRSGHHFYVLCGDKLWDQGGEQSVHTRPRLMRTKVTHLFEIVEKRDV